jgi:hypothetical protein
MRNFCHSLHLGNHLLIVLGRLLIHILEFPPLGILLHRPGMRKTGRRFSLRILLLHRCRLDLKKGYLYIKRCYQEPVCTPAVYRGIWAYRV